MFDFINSVKGLLKTDQVWIDNNVFRMHYIVTFAILITFASLTISQKYITDPINCFFENIPSSEMNKYCLIYSTFTVPECLTGLPFSGVVQQDVESHVEDKDEVKYHKYYQWVCFVLFFKAIMFYLPRYLWKSWEGGLLKMLVMDLQSPIVKKNCKNDRKQKLVDYFTDNWNNHNFYAYPFFTCEALNFINVILQMFFVDYFLGGEFSTHGRDVLKFIEMKPDERKDPMAKIFPKVTKCKFHKNGPSGSVQKFDVFCGLPVNIVNEKIYVFLWFWFIMLSVLSGISLVYRIAVIVMPKFRLLLFRARSCLSSHEEVELIAKKCNIGDWFVLYQVGKNIDPMIFREILTDLTSKFEGKEPPV